MALHVRGVLLPDDEVRDLWIDGDSLSLEPVPRAETVSDNGFILPGLVDAHCHIGIAPRGAPVSSVEQAKGLAMVDRAAGVLAIRDAGSPFDYAGLEDDPEMPRLARAGRHVAPVRRYLPEIGVEVLAEQVAAEVTRQAGRGTGWVKLVGDWIDREVGDLAPAWDEATLAGAVAAAHAAGARITAHCFEENSVAALVRAGIDCVEHGTGLSLDLIDEMARRGTSLVPTMINVERFDELAAGGEKKYPLWAKHMRKLGREFPKVVAAAYEAGVQLYAGSDAGGGIEHGQVAREILRLNATGVSTVDAIAAGSWRAREWLGFDGLADLTIYDRDPRADPRVLLEPARIILRGKVIR
ncbi:MAG TPA: amidohydrolase family protein [Candidatus Limnocylindrales bacterium]|nr:amidohydrolase family protein [Candidatus Limnocylindrales bacterium]